MIGHLKNSVVHVLHIICAANLKSMLHLAAYNNLCLLIVLHFPVASLQALHALVVVSVSLLRLCMYANYNILLQSRYNRILQIIELYSTIIQYTNRFASVVGSNDHRCSTPTSEPARTRTRSSTRSSLRSTMTTLAAQYNSATSFLIASGANLGTANPQYCALVAHQFSCIKAAMMGATVGVVEGTALQQMLQAPSTVFTSAQRSELAQALVAVAATSSITVTGPITVTGRRDLQRHDFMHNYILKAIWDKIMDSGFSVDACGADIVFTVCREIKLVNPSEKTIVSILALIIAARRQQEFAPMQMYELLQALKQKFRRLREMPGVYDDGRPGLKNFPESVDEFLQGHPMAFVNEKPIMSMIPKSVIEEVIGQCPARRSNKMIAPAPFTRDHKTGIVPAMAAGPSAMAAGHLLPEQMMTFICQGMQQAMQHGIVFSGRRPASPALSRSMSDDDRSSSSGSMLAISDIERARNLSERSSSPPPAGSELSTATLGEDTGAGRTRTLPIDLRDDSLDLAAMVSRDAEAATEKKAKAATAKAKAKAKATAAPKATAKATTKKAAAPKAGAARRPLILGCKKCRRSSGGCAQCKNPAFRGARG